MKRFGFLIALKAGLLIGAVGLFVQYSRAVPVTPPETTESNIAKLSVYLLEHRHFSRQPFDAGVADKFLTQYLDALDPQRLHFLQGDLDEFAEYRGTLHELTRQGDTQPAHEIFARFIERLEERVTFATNALAAGGFRFDGDDRYMPIRRTAAHPKDMDEARDLWRQDLRYQVLQERLAAKGDESEASARLARRYNRLLQQFKSWDRHEVFERYIGSLARVYDPHSDYLGKRQFERFIDSMKLSLQGIGAVLTSEDGYCTIRELVVGGPAERSKEIKPKDRIVAVAQGAGEPVDVIDESLQRVVDMIRGPKGTEVRLTIIPGDAADSSVRKIVSLIREEILMEDQEAKAKLIELPGASGKPMRIGVIDLPSFYADMGASRAGVRKRTTPDVRALLQKLMDEKAEGVILDLRRNGGGSLEEAIEVTGLFIRRGPVVQTKDEANRISVDTTPQRQVFYDGPMIVLTSRFSASASEILAGALQDYGRALIVGDSSTHGKGTVQSLEQLGPLMEVAGMSHEYDPGGIKLTIKKFYRASGSSTQREGVIPDIILPSVNNHADVGEKRLDNALPWDVVGSANYRSYNLISPLLPELRSRSEKRIESDHDFSYIREDIEEYRRILEDRSVSLNEERRLRERDERKAREEARKAERQARLPNDYTIWELTVKNAADAGLPEPVKPQETAQAERADGGGGNLLARAGVDDEEDLEAEDSFDVTLEEAKRILQDLIELSAREGLALTQQTQR